MKIQTQAAINTTASSNASAAGGNSSPLAANPLTGQTSTDFSTTLSGILVGVPTQDQPAPQLTLEGLNALVQLMAALKADAGLSEKQQTDDALKQLDALLKLLDSNKEDVSTLLENPEIQSWLAQIQALLTAQQLADPAQNQTQAAGTTQNVGAVETAAISDLNKPTSAQASGGLNPQFVQSENGLSNNTGYFEGQKSLLNSEAQGLLEGSKEQLLQSTTNGAASGELNPLLFVPLAEASASHVALEGLKSLTKSEAQGLLESVKDQLLQARGKQAEATPLEKTFHKLVSELQQVLVPYLSNLTQKESTTQTASTVESANPLVAAKPVSRWDNTSVQVNSGTQPNMVKSDTAIQVQVNTTTVNPKLEYLAAKSVQPNLESTLAVNTDIAEVPLFEPLMEVQADVAGDNPVMPMHEFLRHVESGERMVKTPVIMMQAPAFVEDMTQFIVKSFTMDVRAEGVTEAKLSLYPQNLGHVDVKLTMHNGQLIAQFMAESSAGREMLESQLSQLRTTLQSQGIQVEKLEVTQSQSFQSGLFQEQRQQQSQQSNKQQKGNGATGAVTMDEELAQEAAKASQAPNGAGRTSFDTTA